MIDELLEDLTSNPTEAKWKRELRTILFGRREGDLRRLGDSQDYVEVLLRESRDPVAASDSFHAALISVVTEWQPAKIQSEYFVATMLVLIQAFQPPNGFEKLLAFMREWGGALLENPTRRMPWGREDVHARGMSALAQYYRVPPIPPFDDSPAFRSYVRFLESSLERKEVAIEALVRLLELEIATIDSSLVDGALRLRPDGILDLVRFLLNANRAAQDLPALYTICLSVDQALEERFVEACAHLDLEFRDSRDGPYLLSIHDSGISEISLTSALQQNRNLMCMYLTAWQRRSLTAGISAWHAALQEGRTPDDALPEGAA